MAGRAGAGKDTCANILAGAHVFRPFAFADAVRRELVAAYGVDLRLFIDRSQKEVPTPALALSRCSDARFIKIMRERGVPYDKAISPRWAMRWWGTEYRRWHDGQEYWLCRAHETIEQLHRDGWRRIVITDVRFLNEADFVKGMGGEVWRIRRHLADEASVSHVSELGVDDIPADRTLHNDSTTSALAYDALVAFRNAVAAHPREKDHAEAPHP
ncbi:hypothetical protein L506_2302 [Bordetella bronchiseptica GA96-01]|nr:hypothetical protein CS343_15260 [Bordetella bronchiseptica]KCV40764.1 hypothetical protein L572_2329 [Bordetella bronchiseptica 345]KDC42198.1 hypothetical protein L506_2302 [Bordetella bronchiseptica GA96-01]